MLSPWPARSPDLTPCDSFLWGYMKDKVFEPPQLVSIPDLKNRITAVVETITPDVHRCTVRTVCTVNYLLHIWQRNGCSPLWVRWCSFKILRSLNDLSHKSQQNRLSALCACWCTLRTPCYSNDLVHISQLNGHSTLCALMYLQITWCCKWLITQNNYCSCGDHHTRLADQSMTGIGLLPRCVLCD